MCVHAFLGAARILGLGLILLLINYYIKIFQFLILHLLHLTRFGYPPLFQPFLNIIYLNWSNTSGGRAQLPIPNWYNGCSAGRIQRVIALDAHAGHAFCSFSIRINLRAKGNMRCDRFAEVTNFLISHSSSPSFNQIRVASFISTFVKHF